MLYGSINYMAGTVTANTMRSVMLMLGFNDQVGPNPEDEQITTTTVNELGVSTTTSTSTTYEVVAYDYESLILLQQEWYNFLQSKEACKSQLHTCSNLLLNSVSS